MKRWYFGVCAVACLAGLSAGCATARPAAGTPFAARDTKTAAGKGKASPAEKKQLAARGPFSGNPRADSGNLAARKDASRGGAQDRPGLIRDSKLIPAGHVEGSPAAHDEAIRDLIDRELADASPEEQRALRADLAQLQPDAVRQILLVRRRLIKSQQQTAAAPGQAGRPPIVQPAPPDRRDEQFLANEAFQQAQSSAGLGSISAWNRQGGANLRPSALPYGAPYGTPNEMMPQATPADGMATNYPAGAPRIAAAPGTMSKGGQPPSMTASQPLSMANDGIEQGRAPWQNPPLGNLRPGHYGGEGEQTGARPMPLGNTAVGNAALGNTAASVPVNSATLRGPANAMAGGYDPKVVQAGGAPHEVLVRLISLAEIEAMQAPVGTAETERLAYIEKHVYLRMLYLMSGQYERALQAIPGIDPADQEFWQQTFWALANYFDVNSMPSAPDRAAQTVAQMTNAVLRLQEKANLELRNVNFCHKITSFGNYERFPRDEFSPGQEVLLYAEVANIHSQPAPDGKFQTNLKTTLEIYRHGAQSELIEKIELPEMADVCRTHRRDFFNSYKFMIPHKLGLGPHVLKLLVEDQNSRRVVTHTMNFTVK
jgi:hypothetical protein